MHTLRAVAWKLAPYVYMHPLEQYMLQVGWCPWFGGCRVCGRAATPPRAQHRAQPTHPSLSLPPLPLGPLRLPQSPATFWSNAQRFLPDGGAYNSSAKGSSVDPWAFTQASQALKQAFDQQ